MSIKKKLNEKATVEVKYWQAQLFLAIIPSIAFFAIIAWVISLLLA